MGTAPTVERPLRRPRSEALRELRRRELQRRAQRERRAFGGRIQWEAAFFGLLAAIGLGASLVAMTLGGLVAVGVTDFREDAASLVDRMMAGGGAIAVAILALAYLAGGYVAARMARFDGWRQGLGVWLLSVSIAVAAAITAWVAGGRADPTASISLPSNPIGDGPLAGSGWGILVVGVVIPLAASVLGGVIGERFHRAVDRAAFDEPAAEHDAEPEPDPETQTETDPEPEPEDRATRPARTGPDA